jgi:hypothetical protein
VVDHCVIEGIAWQTIYNALNRRKNGQSKLCDTHPRSSFILGIFYKGKIEETGKQPKRNESIQVKLNILQESSTIGRNIQKLAVNN